MIITRMELKETPSWLTVQALTPAPSSNIFRESALHGVALLPQTRPLLLHSRPGEAAWERQLGVLLELSSLLRTSMLVESKGTTQQSHLWRSGLCTTKHRAQEVHLRTPPHWSIVPFVIGLEYMEDPQSVHWKENECLPLECSPPSGCFKKLQSKPIAFLQAGSDWVLWFLRPSEVLVTTRALYTIYQRCLWWLPFILYCWFMVETLQWPSTFAGLRDTLHHEYLTEVTWQAWSQKSGHWRFGGKGWKNGLKGRIDTVAQGPVSCCFVPENPVPSWSEYFWSLLESTLTETLWIL